MNSKFKADYYAEFGQEWTFSTGVKRLLQSRELRYIFYGRCSFEASFKPARLVFRLLRHKMANKLGTEISFQNVGGGITIAHGYAITITARAVLGENVSLRKGITIGIEARGERAGAPIIGNEVWIGPSASIVGRITIGDDVLIAPNSYVNFNVPSHSIVIGNPAKVIPVTDGRATEGYIRKMVTE